MKVLLVGSEGSIGQRYKAILNYLKVPFFTYDVKTDRRNVLYKEYSHLIVATPTYTHLDIAQAIPKDVFALIEKPIVTKEKDLLTLEKALHPRIFQVNQYAYIPGINGDGETYYNFFRTGSDGILFDCITLIYLAKSIINLGNTSPFWQCKINGRDILYQSLEQSYVNMIKDFLGKREFLWNEENIIKAHKAVFDLASNYKKTNMIKLTDPNLLITSREVH